MRGVLHDLVNGLAASGNRFVLKDPLYKWLEDEFNKNPGWDKFVTSLVTATGPNPLPR